MRPLDPTVRAHLRPARRSLSVVLAASGAQALLVVAQAFVVGGGIVAMVDHRRLAGWVTALLVVTLLRAAASLASDAAAARAAGTVRADLRRRLLAAVVGRRERPTPESDGALVVLATRGVQETEPYLTRYLPALVLATVLPFVSVVAIAVEDWLSALIVVLTIPLLPIFAALVGWRTRDRAARQWREMAQLAGHFLDVVKGLPTLVAFRRGERQIQTIRRITNRYRVATMDTLKLAFASSAVLELVATISVALVAVSIGLRLANGSLDLRTGLTVLLLAPEAYWPVRRVGAEFHAAAQGTATFTEVDRLLAEPVPERPTTDADGMVTASVARRPAAPLRLSLHDVSVTYPGQSQPGLAATTADLPTCGLVTVTGPSGAGKTTLLGVLQGRLPPTSGAVLVSGVPLAELDPDWWCHHVAWSPQRPYFVNGSVADNLRLGRPDAPEAVLWSALGQVGMSAVVSALPGGLGAMVSQDGLSLSAGERARLALARVLVADRPVVLLDEPTAHLDPESERIVVATIGQLAETALVVAVSHRPALAAAASTVLHLPGRRRATAQPRPAVSGAMAAFSSGTAERAVAPAGRRAPDGPADATSSSPGPRRTRLLVATSIVLGALAAGSGVALTATAGWLIVKASMQPNVLLLLVAIVAVRTFGIARPALRYAERVLSHDAALRLLAEKRTQVYAALVPLTPARLGRRRGDVLTSVVDDVEAWVDRRLRVLMPMATMVLAGSLAVVVALVMLPGAGLLDLGLLVLAGGAGYGFVGWRVSRSDRTWVHERAALSVDITELVEGRDELRAWGAVGDRLGRVDARSRRVEHLATMSSRSAGEGRAITTLLVGIAVASSLAVAASGLSAASVSAPVAALLVVLPLAMGDLLLPAADAAVADVQTRRTIRRLAGLLGQAPAVVEAATTPLPPGPRAVRLDAVAAGWTEPPAFRSLDLALPAGGRIGVVGPSGSGKSTLAALLVRFLDPMEGAVTYGGVDLRSASFDDVRQRVGLLDDDPHVFASSVVENIRLARPGASDADVVDALEAASLGQWLSDLPDGVHTWVGEGHRAVSGGERARLGLARVVLAGQPVVVLDEPTAHLDADTADQVMRSVFEGASGRSILLVTHRPEGLDLVDRVVSLQAPSDQAAERTGLAAKAAGTFSSASSA